MQIRRKIQMLPTRKLRVEKISDHAGTIAFFFGVPALRSARVHAPRLCCELVMMILLRNGRFRVHGVGQGLHGLEEDVTLHAELVEKESGDFRVRKW